MSDIEVIEQFRCLIAKFKEQQKRLALAIQNSDYDDPVFETIDNFGLHPCG